MDVQLTCKRCQGTWKRRTVGRLPKQCPHCKSIRWNKDYVKRKERQVMMDEVSPRSVQGQTRPSRQISAVTGDHRAVETSDRDPEPPEIPEIENEPPESTEELWLKGKL